MRRYSDAQLSEAVRAKSWHGVLRGLGLAATSSAAMRSVRTHADRLGLDYSHFTGQRRWTDQQLSDAVASAASWTEVAEILGLVGGSSRATIRGHAVRLGLATAHLDAAATCQPGPGRLPVGRGMVRALWVLRLVAASKPCRYDLLVWMGANAQRVQVKTTTVKQGTSWTAWISNTGKKRTTYDPNEVDHFFVIDGDFDYYRIPMTAVAGFTAIQLSAYTHYKLSRVAHCQPLDSTNSATSSTM